MSKAYEQSETGCCPRFNPEPWDNKEISFQDKLFVKDHVSSFLHIPLNFGKVMTKNMDIITKSGAVSPDPLVLSDEKSAWSSDVYIAVNKEIPGVKIEKMTGKYLSKVFEGNYKDMGKWVAEMNNFIRSKGKTLEKMFFFYTTCPKCAKYYGKNYTVILAKV
jgi:hypothetical protein